MTTTPWYALETNDNLISPSLLVYPDRIDYNIRSMIAIAGGTDRLRPHIKTHKMAEVIRMQMAHGINKFKCATIAEAQLLGSCEAGEALLALQPVGPNLRRFLALIAAYPKTAYATILDDAGIATELNALAGDHGVTVPVYLDINAGMDRTGIRPGSGAMELYRLLTSLPHLRVMGFHVYDGHIRDTGLQERTASCEAAFAPVWELKKALEKQGMQVEEIIAGGSPSFPVHARKEGVDTSPGTTLLWDQRYGSSFPDMDFLPAAVLFSRIISKPGNGLLCLDLGHKAIAPEMPFPRVHLLGMEDCEQLSQSEEHLVLRCPHPEKYRVGDACYALPMHVCPTVAKYPLVHTVKGGAVTGSWEVAARDHRMTI